MGWQHDKQAAGGIIPHIIILFDEDGNQIGSYYPDHDAEGGGGRTEGPRVELDEKAIAQAIETAIGKRTVDSVRVKFKAGGPQLEKGD